MQETVHPEGRTQRDEWVGGGALRATDRTPFRKLEDFGPNPEIWQIKCWKRNQTVAGQLVGEFLRRGLPGEKSPCRRKVLSLQITDNGSANSFAGYSKS